MNGRKEIPMKINEELEQLLKNLKLRRILDIYDEQDRKSTRLNSSHSQISYAVFCLKKKKNRASKAEPTECRTVPTRRPVVCGSPVYLYAIPIPPPARSLDGPRRSHARLQLSNSHMVVIH